MPCVNISIAGIVINIVINNVVIVIVIRKRIGYIERVFY